MSSANPDLLERSLESTDEEVIRAIDELIKTHRFHCGIRDNALREELRKIGVTDHKAQTFWMNLFLADE